PPSTRTCPSAEVTSNALMPQVPTYQVSPWTWCGGEGSFQPASAAHAAAAGTAAGGGEPDAGTASRRTERAIAMRMEAAPEDGPPPWQRGPLRRPPHAAGKGAGAVPGRACTAAAVRWRAPGARPGRCRHRGSVRPGAHVLPPAGPATG